MSRPLHSDFRFLLELKEKSLINLYTGLREFILDLNPDANELLYHTHALTSVYSISEKLADAYCLIPIYTNHLNLGFSYLVWDEKWKSKHPKHFFKFAESSWVSLEFFNLLKVSNVASNTWFKTCLLYTSRCV